MSEKVFESLGFGKKQRFKKDKACRFIIKPASFYINF